MNEFANCGFLITAYKQVEYVLQNIERIRCSYKKLHDCPIVVVSTSEVDVGFGDLERFPYVTVDKFFDAPGNPQCSWFKWKEPEWQGYNGWGHKWIPIRVFHSIDRGVDILHKMEANRILHLHSDTYWQEEKEDKLCELFDELNGYDWMGDLAIDEENSGAIPKGFHFHPEGLFFNLTKGRITSFPLFSGIYHPVTGFKTHNYASTTANIGQVFHYTITGKNILDKNSVVEDKYFKKHKVIQTRFPHGEFPNGLVNAETRQGKPNE